MQSAASFLAEPPTLATSEWSNVVGYGANWLGLGHLTTVPNTITGVHRGTEAGAVRRCAFSSAVALKESD